MPEVGDQLDSVLSSLYDFGDDFEARGKKITKKISETLQSQGLSEAKETGNTNGSEEPLLPPTPGSKRKRKNVSLFFDSLKDELRGRTEHVEVSATGARSVPGSQQGGPQSVEVVTFISQRGRRKTKAQAEQERDSEVKLDLKETEESSHTFNFEKARLEVHKFGITGYKKEKQRTFEQERAIMLGARPPKKEYLNYKVYQEKVKERGITKQEESRKEKVSEPAKKRRKRGQEVRRPKRSKSGGIIPTGHVGKFKNGALILSGKDIKKIKQSKVIK
ncbi:40S small subunit processome assembly factor 1 [Ascaphus truei]|uniref:40S small subunit processome assembly factor 1 n=1 Tax=Ascaphus truei TaxID=8439 RepID=UPI003F5A0067